MSHQRYASQDTVKEPHQISLKVLRLSRPSLVTQYPIPLSTASSQQLPIPASLAYSSNADSNTDPFILSPILNLPPTFGSAYVGETFSCTLCANRDIVEPSGYPASSTSGTKISIRDVRIEAEMKTPSSANAVKLDLLPDQGPGSAARGVDLETGQTLQKVVNFDLKEEGNHVLSVTVSYYEATETSGRTRTFRKLYQFICKASLIVRTKASAFSTGREGGRRWVLEAQLENCSEDAIQLERVVLDLEPSLRYDDCNWEASRSPKPVLHPGEVEQVCFLLEETGKGVQEQAGGKIGFGVLGIGWRSEMGNRGYLSTGRLGTRAGK